jgi:hypothetical protein
MNAYPPAGLAVASTLSGAWRKDPPRLSVPVEVLAATIPLLLKSGAGALGWWKIWRANEPALSAILPTLDKTYWSYLIHAAKDERRIIEVFRALRSAAIEPILIKGWAIARLYPQPGLRPSGDIDLYISPEHLVKARSVLRAPEYQRYAVDLDHDEITRFSECSFDELYRCSELVKLGDTEIRVLSAEDHLRLLCLHLLKHGAWRPLWLCDVAAALESRSASFDWSRCLGKNSRWADWVLCATSLANRLLGAELGDTPLRSCGNTVPRWLIPAVLKQWEAPYPPHLPLFVKEVGENWWNPEIVRAICRRWPNPIQATIDANGPFDDMPRLPYQIGNCAVRAVKGLPTTCARRTAQATRLRARTTHTNS